MHVPVKSYSATESRTVQFHEVHLEDGARIEHRRFCAKEDREVSYEELVKGYEVASGEDVSGRSSMSRAELIEALEGG